jgi:hypothetical protein
LFCGKPVCGDMPMLVALDILFEIAQIELLPPKWHEMIRAFGLSIRCDVRSAMYRWLAP